CNHMFTTTTLSTQVKGDTLEYEVKKKFEEINVIVYGVKYLSALRSRAKYDMAILVTSDEVHNRIESGGDYSTYQSSIVNNDHTQDHASDIQSKDTPLSKSYTLFSEIQLLKQEQPITSTLTTPSVHVNLNNSDEEFLDREDDFVVDRVVPHDKLHTC
ncbi:1795_t:CDS:2, partial [Rhizophagus irregularis]